MKSSAKCTLHSVDFTVKCSLTVQRRLDITNMEKACKIRIKTGCAGYNNAVLDLDPLDLAERKKKLCIVHAKKSPNNNTIDYQ